MAPNLLARFFVGHDPSTQYCPNIAAACHSKVIGSRLLNEMKLDPLTLLFRIFDLVCEVDVVSKQCDSSCLCGEQKARRQNYVIRPTESLSVTELVHSISILSQKQNWT